MVFDLGFYKVCYDTIGQKSDDISVNGHLQCENGFWTQSIIQCSEIMFVHNNTK